MAGGYLVAISLKDIAGIVRERSASKTAAIHATSPMGTADNSLRLDPTMRSKSQIHKRLRELHGESVDKQMGGFTALKEAETLLWALGYEWSEIDVQPDANSPAYLSTDPIDVSEYIEID